MHSFRTKVVIFMLPLLLPIGAPRDSGAGLGGFAGGGLNASGSQSQPYAGRRPMPVTRSANAGTDAVGAQQ